MTSSTKLIQILAISFIVLILKCISEIKAQSYEVSCFLVFCQVVINSDQWFQKKISKVSHHAPIPITK